MNKNLKRKSFVIAISVHLSVFMACMGSRAQDTGGAIESCIIAWERRMASIDSARFDWLETEVSVEELRNPFTGHVVDTPPTGSERRFSWLMRGDTQKVHCEGGYEWLGSGSELSWRHRPAEAYEEASFVVDGTSILLSYPSHKHSDDNYPSATKRNAERFSTKYGYSLMPIIFYCRQAEPWFIDHVDYSAATVETETEVNGHRCIVMSVPFTPPNSKPGRRELWVLPERDWVVTRYIYWSQGHKTAQLDIEYDTNSNLQIPVPTSWKIARGMDERISITKTAKVTSYELNTKVTNQELAVHLPDGCILTDRTADNGKTYLIHNGGQRRELTPMDREGSYQQLVGNVSGRTDSVNFRLASVVIVLVVAVALILGFLGRTFYSSRT